MKPCKTATVCRFQHTAARRRLGADYVERYNGNGKVSTHSRPKAAGTALDIPKVQILSFNTQPPEGGWFYLQAQ